MDRGPRRASVHRVTELTRLKQHSTAQHSTAQHSTAQHGTTLTITLLAGSETYTCNL